MLQSYRVKYRSKNISFEQKFVKKLMNKGLQNMRKGKQFGHNLFHQT
jgi:hypothetical protein